MCDYDYNADSSAHLADTHEKLVRAVRRQHPDVPIVMMTRPKLRLTAEEQKRREVIETTFANAKAAGDTDVYLLTGDQLMAMAGPEGTVEGVHPTDLGFASMALALGDLLEKICR